jgi:tRNA pseudouridine55 synthase
MTTEERRQPRRRVDGVLLLDKPAGPSSHAVLRQVKRLFAAEKAGHTGTLDPLASGLLPVCFGEATKFAQSLLEARKTYVASVRFGAATSTGDAEGEVIAERPVAFSRADLERALTRFLGAIRQVPPIHSALKFKGRKYYEYARAGIDIPRAAREVEIDSIEVLDWMPPDAILRVACSTGTYVRVLAADLGSALDNCAHLAGLRRVGSGPFTVESAITLDALEALDAVQRDAVLLAPHSLLAGVPRLTVGAQAAAAICAGRGSAVPATPSGRYCCFDRDGRFIGVVDVDADVMRPVRLMRVAPSLKL